MGGSLSAGSFDGTGKIWTATYTATDDFDGTGSVTLANDSYTDAALNLGSGGSDSVTIDTKNPTATVAIDDAGAERYGQHRHGDHHLQRGADRLRSG